jgi:hypothetical protein
MAVSLSVATTAVSSTKFNVVDSGEVGRAAVYRKHNIGPRTLSLGTPDWGWFCVLSLNFYEEVSAM